MILKLLAGVFIVVALFIVYMIHRAQKDYLSSFTIEDRTFPSTSKFRLLFISDVHNRSINKETLENIRDIDLIIIGGDLVDKRTTEQKLNLNIDRLLKFRVPVYFIPGNNDHEFQGKNLLDVLDDKGVHTLSNEDHSISISGGNKIVLSGMDPYFMRPRRTMSAIHDTSDYQILCVHDPSVYKKMNKEDQKRFNLILSGHTHGGQIRIFGLGPYQKGGWNYQEHNKLFVSEGYGTSLLPLRIGTKAECHIITIHSANVV